MIEHFIRKWARREQLSRLLVVSYHNILPTEAHEGLIGTSVSDFQRQITWLKKHFSVLHLEDAIDSCRSGGLLNPTAAITFDDGYETQKSLGAQALKQLNLPATFFLNSGQLADNIMWNDCFRLFAAHAANTQWCELQSLLGIPKERNMTPPDKNKLQRIETNIKYRTLDDRKPIVDFMKTSTPAYGEVLRMMDEQSIRQLTKDGFEVGAHSLTHPILALENDANAERQISEDIGNLNSIIDQQVTSFAIPNGKPTSDYTKEHIKMLARNGIQRVMTSSFGHFSPGRDPMQVARVSLTGSSEIHYLRIVRQAYMAPINIVTSRGYENHN